MGSPRSAGYTGKPSRLLVLTSLLLLVTLPAGCNTTNKAKQDPLFGVNPPGAAPAPSPPASAVRTKNETSAAPSSLGPNLAWLSTLPDSRPLAIGQPQAASDWRSPGAAALASAAKNPQSAGLSAPVPLVQPVPRAGEDPVVPASTWDKAAATVPSQPPPEPPTVPTVAAGVSVPQPPPAAKPAAAPQQPAASEDPLLTAIRAHGITWQDARNVAGGVSFRAIVPDRQNPGRMRTYEAIGPDYPSAVRAVLYKIDKEQK